ncbi:MAG: pyridoxal phosphate-dependent aminotransferase [Proteobacteria bacterium]|nr:MAG: pyridoxal phosphate-dependent aminotransferase [Pseudomonadota bacterium]
MDHRFSPMTERLAGRGARAWEIHGRAVAARGRGEDVIILSVGDPEFDTPPMISAAAKRALDAGDTHYVEICGRPALRALIAERHRARTGQQVTADNVAMVPGAQAGLFCASLCLGSPGDEFLTTDPVYTTYEATLQAPGARRVAIPLQADEGFRLDLDRLEAAVGERTRALFLANPNNPTGTLLRDDEMAAVAELARRHDLWIVADEVYADLVFESRFRHFASIPEIRDRLVTVSSLSKSHAMTGWRVGWMVMPSAMTPHIENLLLSMLYGMPGFIQAAALTAIRDGDDDVERMRRAYRARRDLVLSRLAECPLLRCVAPEAGMFMLVDVAATGLDNHEFVTRLYQQQHVSVLDAEAFGAVGRGFVRLSFSGGEARLEEGCRRIIEFVHGLGAGESAASVQ